jgi:hypothetical protein
MLPICTLSFLLVLCPPKSQRVTIGDRTIPRGTL